VAYSKTHSKKASTKKIINIADFNLIIVSETINKGREEKGGWMDGI
jgi:hypothetical protein